MAGIFRALISRTRLAEKGEVNIQKAFNASKSGASQSRNYDTYEPEPTTRTKLSDQDLADLASKYDPSNMTQDQYDAFLDELVEKGVLTRGDTTWLGYNGLVRLDTDFDEIAAGKTGGACVINGDTPAQSLDESEGDLLRWLESMPAQQDQWTGPSGRERKEALDALYDVVRRM